MKKVFEKQQPTKFHYWWLRNETGIKTILLSVMTSLLTNAIVMLLLLLMLAQR